MLEKQVLNIKFRNSAVKKNRFRAQNVKKIKQNIPQSNWSRRGWLGVIYSTLAIPARPVSAGTIQTVTGAVSAAALGRTLVHEHIVLDFIGAAKLTPERYVRDEAFELILPHLREARAAGVRTIVDATPEHLGRDAVLLRRLSAASDVQIVASTGIYSARGEQYVPDYARAETAEQLASRFTQEIEKGIGNTGIRAGVIRQVSTRSREPRSGISKRRSQPPRLWPTMLPVPPWNVIRIRVTRQFNSWKFLQPPRLRRRHLSGYTPTKKKIMHSVFVWRGPVGG